MPLDDVDEPPYSVEQLDKKKHDRSSFSSGKERLDDYIKKYARQDKKRWLAQAYILTKTEESTIVGYYTLSNFAVKPNAYPPDIKNDLPEYDAIPATRIGRLAVDQEYQGMRLGKALLFNALRRSYNMANCISSFSVFVDLIDEEAREFYTKYHFQPLPERRDRLYLPMKTIKELI